MGKFAPIGRQIWRARNFRGLTQEQLAVKMGVSQQLIARLEKDDSNPTLRTIVRVCEALDFELGVVLKKRHRR